MNKNKTEKGKKEETRHGGGGEGAGERGREKIVKLE